MNGSALAPRRNGGFTLARAATAHLNAEAKERIKACLVDPLAVCAALGVDGGSSAQAAGVMIRCPWHDDTRPSCSVTVGPKGTLRVRCFSCGAGGDVFSIVAAAAGLDPKADFAKVLEYAAALADCNPSSVPVASPPTPAVATEFALVGEALLAMSPLTGAVADYLASRGILERAVEDGWGALAPTSKRGEVIDAVARAVGEAAWNESGLRGPHGDVAFADHRVVIPWRDAGGALATLQRRRLVGDVPKYVFPSGRPARGPYGIEHVARALDDATITFVEGAMDVLAYRELAARDGRDELVVGVPGISAVARSLPIVTGRVCRIALDADEAGDRGARALFEALHAAGAAKITRVRPAAGKDWADALKAASR